MEQRKVRWEQPYAGHISELRTCITTLLRTNAFYVHVPWQHSIAALLRENAVKVCVLQTIDTNSRGIGSKLLFLSG
jgi:hypothetical protein